MLPRRVKVVRTEGTPRIPQGYYVVVELLTDGVWLRDITTGPFRTEDKARRQAAREEAR